MAASLDLRRAGSCFTDMNGRLAEFRSWSAANRRRPEPKACDGSGVVLLTAGEVEARRSARGGKLQVDLRAKAAAMLEFKRTEAAALREELGAETARAQAEAAVRVQEAAVSEAEAGAAARGQRAALDKEASVLREELRRKEEEEEEAQDEEDERVCRENAQANKRQRTTATDPQEKAADLRAILSQLEERASAVGTELINARREREEEEARAAEHSAELAALREQSGQYEGGQGTLAERVGLLKQDRERELATLEARAAEGGGAGSAEVRRDAALRHLVSFLREDAPSQGQMRAMETLLQEAYGGASAEGEGGVVCAEARVAAAAALAAKTGLTLPSD